MRSERGNAIPQLVEGLAGAGICPGDFLVMHSSYKALGLPGATPADVICSIAEALGAEGTLMAPTFTYSYAGIYQVQPFNRAKTPGLFNGILTETLRQYPGAYRSDHPTYSVAALGKHAERVTQHKAHASALGVGSSYHDAYQLGAKILMLGVSNAFCSMLHYAEAVSGLPYNAIPFREFWGRTALVEDDDGHVSEVPLLEEFPACSSNFGVADAFLLEKNVLTRTMICQAKSSLMSAVAMVDAVVERLHKEPSWLLCNSFVCEPCNLRKRKLLTAGLL